MMRGALARPYFVVTLLFVIFGIIDCIWIYPQKLFFVITTS